MILPEKLLDITFVREPTEAETRMLPATIADDSGQHDRVPITQAQVDALTAIGKIYYCGECTRATIVVGENGEDDLDRDNTYAAREYHTEYDIYAVGGEWEAYVAEMLTGKERKDSSV